MTPKEEAKELVDRFKPFVDDSYGIFDENTRDFNELENAKQCALIYVSEIIKENGYYKDTSIHTSKGRLKYWIEVKEEISKL